MPQGVVVDAGARVVRVDLCLDAQQWVKLDAVLVAQRAGPADGAAVGVVADGRFHPGGSASTLSKGKACISHAQRGNHPVS